MQKSVDIEAKLIWNKKGDKLKPIARIILKDKTIITIYQGTKGDNPDLDFVVKYLDLRKTTRLRTPKHIHWVIDLLIKKEHNRILTMGFITFLYQIWGRLEPLKRKQEQLDIYQKLSLKKELEQFEELDNYGEYSVEFITYVIGLFVIEEKTGMAGAFMFKELFDAMLMEKDIFYVVSKATHNGKL